MSHLIITRDMKPHNYGTFGRLSINGEFKGITVEQPYNSNKPFESCVPDGEYELLKYNSQNYGTTFLAVNPELNVYAFSGDRIDDTGRYGCLFFHKGSYPRNFQGCCGVGHKLAMNGQGELLASGTTDNVEHILSSLIEESDRHTLSIMSAEPNLWSPYD